MSKICVNCVKEINSKEAFCLSCHEEVVETAKKKIDCLEAKLEEMTEKYNACQEARKLEIEFNQQDKAQLKQQLAEKDKEYQDAVANCVSLANTKAILKLHKVQDRIDDMKSKYDCDIEYHSGANNELTHLWEYIDKLIEEMMKSE